jgi:hypothetical protein
MSKNDEFSCLVDQGDHGKIQYFFCEDGHDMATKLQVTINFDLLNNLDILLLLSYIFYLLETIQYFILFLQAREILNCDFINAIKNLKHSCIPCVDATTKFGLYVP